MMNSKKSLLAAGTATLLSTFIAGCGSTATAAASHANAATYFKGKTITLIAPDKPGGGYDTWARLVAPYMAKVLGATIKVVNIPEAGTIAGTNEMADAKPNGLTLGLVNTGGDIGNLIEGVPGQKFNLKTLTWLGQPQKEPEAIFARIPSSYHAFSQLLSLSKSRAVTVLDTRSGSADLTNRIVFNGFGIPHKFLLGYGSSKGLEAGFLRGDGPIATVTYTSWENLVLGGKARPLMVSSLSQTWSGNPQVPTLGYELSHVKVSPKAAKALKTLGIMDSLGYDFAGPPGIPANLVKVLRTAFHKALTNPKLIAQAKKEHLHVVYTNAPQLQKNVLSAIHDSTSLKPYLGV